MTATAEKPATAEKVADKPATKAGVSPRHTACVCPECGAEAGYDLAPNPGPPAGGEHASPPPPPPEVVTPPPEPPPMPGQWYMVICSTGLHRTLWPEARLEELAPPDEVLPEAGAIKSHAPGPGGNKLWARDIPAPDPRAPRDPAPHGPPPPEARKGHAPAPHAEHGHGHDKK